MKPSLKYVIWTWKRPLKEDLLFDIKVVKWVGFVNIALLLITYGVYFLLPAELRAEIFGWARWILLVVGIIFMFSLLYLLPHLFDLAKDYILALYYWHTQEKKFSTEKKFDYLGLRKKEEEQIL